MTQLWQVITPTPDASPFLTVPVTHECKPHCHQSYGIRGPIRPMVAVKGGVLGVCTVCFQGRAGNLVLLLEPARG